MRRPLIFPTMSKPMPLDESHETIEQVHAIAITQSHDQQSYNLNSINSTIVIRQLPSQGLSFQLWPAAATLVALLDRHRSSNDTPLASVFTTERRLKLLELGSGTGVVGIAASALLGASVTVTDLPHVVPNMQFNVDANIGILDRQGGTVDVEALSWGDVGDMERIGGRGYDVILGSDVVYHDHLYEPLLETLKFFLLGNEEKKVVFLMSHLKRWKKESAFFKKAKKYFDVEVIHTDSPCNGSRVGVNVYTFVRRCVGKGKCVLSEQVADDVTSAVIVRTCLDTHC